MTSTMERKRLYLLLALLLALPLFAANNDEHLSLTLKDLHSNLKRDYLQMAKTQDRLAENYESQHRKMVNIMKQCNELSLML